MSTPLDVLDERALQSERLAALPARKWLFSGVEPLVVLEDRYSVLLFLMEKLPKVTAYPRYINIKIKVPLKGD